MKQKLVESWDFVEFITSIYLLFKQSSSGYNTVSNATAEFSNDALQNFGRNWYDDLVHNGILVLPGVTEFKLEFNCCLSE